MCGSKILHETRRSSTVNWEVHSIRMSVWTAYINHIIRCASVIVFIIDAQDRTLTKLDKIVN